MEERTKAGLPRYVTAAQIAEAYSVDTEYVYRLARTGRLPEQILPGGRIKRFAVTDVLRVFNSTANGDAA